MHTRYGMCVKPVADGVRVGVFSSCSVTDKWTSWTAQGSLQYKKKMCLKPETGGLKPEDNVKLVLDSACNEPQNFFEFVPTPGWYLYIEASSPRKPNDADRFISPSTTEAKSCLFFFTTCTALTWVNFRSGTKVSWIDALKISATGVDSSMAKSFKIQLGMLSGPEALPRFRLLSFEKTSSADMKYLFAISLLTAESVSAFLGCCHGGKELVVCKKLWLILDASSPEWISFPETMALVIGFFLGNPASCLTDFHHEPALSQFWTLFAKKKPRSRLHNLFTLFLNFLKSSGSLNIACCRCWITMFNSGVIQGLSVIIHV